MMYAIDTETHLISRENPIPQVVCMTIADAHEADLVTGGDIYTVARVLLQDPEVSIVGCNIAFDLAVLARAWPCLLPDIVSAYQSGRVTDVAIRQQLWDIKEGRVRGEEAPSYSLAYLSELILNQQMTGKTQKLAEVPWRLRYSELDGVPLEDWPAEAVRYATEDARTTYDIWLLQEEIKDDIKEHNFFSESAFYLHLVGNAGLRTDPKRVAEFEVTHTAILAEVKHQLLQEGMLTLNRDGSIKKNLLKAREVVAEAFAAQGKPHPETPSGKVATDHTAILLANSPIMNLWLRYVAAEKMLTTYLPILTSGLSGPIHTRIKLAATGRTTSSSPGQPLQGGNFQNAPRAGGYRECFVPAPGKLFVAADFSGAELHTLAQVCLMRVGYSRLGEALNRGEDIHMIVARQLVSGNDPEELKAARQDAKAANFGFPGGMRENTFIKTQLKQRGKLWKYADAKMLRQAWATSYPEMGDYHAWCTQALGPEGCCIVDVPLTNFRRYVDSLPIIANTQFQGLAAFGARAALNAVVKAAILSGGAFRVVNFVHDEIICEVPDDNEEARRIAYLLKNTMEANFNVYVPDYPVTAEPVVMRYWSKDAKQSSDDTGLIPWGDL